MFLPFCFCLFVVYRNQPSNTNLNSNIFEYYSSSSNYQPLGLQLIFKNPINYIYVHSYNSICIKNTMLNKTLIKVIMHRWDKLPTFPKLFKSIVSLMCFLLFLHKTGLLCISQFHLCPSPQANPRALAFFFFFYEICKFPGVGTL